MWKKLKFKLTNWRWRWHYWIRRKLTMPLANKLIGSHKPYIVRIKYNNAHYEARYHRAQYWYDNERITIKGILRKRKIYHVSYWDGGEKGLCWCEMFGWGQSMIEVKRGDDIEILVTQELAHVIAMWLKYIVNPNKEKDHECNPNA